MENTKKNKTFLNNMWKSHVNPKMEAAYIGLLRFISEFIFIYSYVYTYINKTQYIWFTILWFFF